MRVVYKEVPTTVELSNAYEILDYGESLRSWLDNFLKETKKLKSSEITATIEIRELNNIKINYDVVRITRQMKEYKKLIQKLDLEIDQFIEEVANIKFNKKVPEEREEYVEKIMERFDKQMKEEIDAM